MGLSARDIAFIIALCGVTTLNVFLIGAVTVALPTIGRDLNFREGNLYWPVNVNSLSFGGLLLFCGRLGDIFGNRFMFLVGSLWFAIWSLAMAFVPSSDVFIVDMALLGIGSAANTPAAIGLCSSYFPPGANRSKAFSALGVGSPVGFVLGIIASEFCVATFPIDNSFNFAGGLLTESRATWRSLFCIQAARSLDGWFPSSCVDLFRIDTVGHCHRHLWVERPGYYRHKSEDAEQSDNPTLKSGQSDSESLK
ncbi:major facilitator superfamily domain-containing protein [Suillus subaureus]|uniref:Major facilitator superfamily domain-containing protein n=1 Tax=Suillus subaureus TaxID=48587 RepID=A0A9P7EM80_9AGAM|nr:major facilitator superfamily domain-containing protein [Suillus subaureus]KAG1824941.1 major facilitator superfamily domain-containing protein [Suillus subaureus]